LIFSTDSLKSPGIKFHGFSSSRNRDDICGHTDRRTWRNRQEIFAAVRTRLKTLKFVPCWFLFFFGIERTGTQRVRTASVGQALYKVFDSEHVRIRVALKIMCSYPVR